MDAKKESPKTLWLIWVGIISSVFVIQVMEGGGVPSGEDQGEAPSWILCLSIVVIFIATVIRWLLIPKADNFQKVLVLFVVGMALSESVAFYGMFLLGPELPESRLAYLILSVISMFQFVPTYASRFESKQVD